MRKIAILALLGGFVFASGMAAHAAVSTWLWWGANSNVIVPVSATNPLPVQCS